MLTNEWLILSLTSRLRGKDADMLLERFGTVDAIVNAGAAALSNSGLEQRTIKDITTPDERLLARCHDWLASAGHHIVTWADARYPALLRDIYHAPLSLFVRGDVDVLTLPQIAIVGSRYNLPVDPRPMRDRVAGVEEDLHAPPLTPAASDRIPFDSLPAAPRLPVQPAPVEQPEVVFLSETEIAEAEIVDAELVEPAETDGPDILFID